MKQIEADIIKAAAKLHDAVLNKGARSIEADVALGEVVAAVDKVINAKPSAVCVTCEGASLDCPTCAA